MALQAVVFPQYLSDNYSIKELCGLGGGEWNCDLDGENCNYEGWNANSLSPDEEAPADGRRKRGRARKCKNKEEVERQRMTHIVIQRNHRKQMNEYLGVFRSLMPPSYLRRSDQASIAGGAINFVKELEQLLQSLQVKKRIKQQSEEEDGKSSSYTTNPFSDFFTFPQYLSFSKTAATTISKTNNTMAENRSMVERHANLKILMRRRPMQLLKMVMELQNLRLTTLHLNVTSLDQLVLYSFDLKVEDCRFTSVNEIATAVYRLVGKIQEVDGVN